MQATSVGPIPGRVSEQTPDQKAPVDTGVICLALIARFFDIPVSPEQLLHAQGGMRFGAVEILRSSDKLGLKARQVKVSIKKITQQPLPAIVILSIPSPDDPAAPPTEQFMVLAKTSADQVTLHDPVAQKAITMTPGQLAEKWSGQLIRIARRDQSASNNKSFDISWFIPSIVKYRHLFRDVMVASLLFNMFGLGAPLFFQVVMDKVLVHRGIDTLDVLVIGIIGIAVFETLTGGMRTYLFSHTTNRIDVELGATLYRHMTNLPMAFFQSRRVGESVARVRELDKIRDFITGAALTLLIDVSFAGVFLAVMFYYAPILAWIVVGSFAFYILLGLTILPPLRKKMEEQFAKGATNQAFLVESVTGIETVKSMAVEPQFRRRWEEQLAAFVKTGFEATKLSNVSGQLSQLISKVTMALCLWLGAQAVIDGNLTIGQLIAFNMLSQRVTQPILRLVQLWQEFQQARISVERLGDILNTPTEPGMAVAGACMPRIQGKVSFKEVIFQYDPDGKVILRNLSVDIPAGQVIGIVGPSGSGKSTLTKLIQRMYTPTQGRVLIDDQDLALADPAWLRRQIGVVLQENLLFNMSVRDNIALADPAMAMEQIIAAAQIAGAHEFITELPQGYETVVGERGDGLSGGQRQRIAIARALVTNPRILILDEATSALDYESEAIIQENMRQICAGRTVFIIAHRLSTVRDSDRILTLEDGCLVEDGSHSELLKTGGRYAKLWQMQASGPRAVEI